MIINVLPPVVLGRFSLKNGNEISLKVSSHFRRLAVTSLFWRLGAPFG
jgi:hypothetical protein